jgi:glyoxylase-like metal-dependent hydrolase (beta-lactamase superfamily II)
MDPGGRRCDTRVIDIVAGFARCQLVIAKTVTLIDAGNARAVLAGLTREGISPAEVRRIVLTHGDADHWRGAAALQRISGAEVVAHEGDRSYFAGRPPRGFSLPKRLLVALDHPRDRPRIDRWLHGGEILDGLEIIHAPGHTPGNICVIAGDALIAGDVLRTGSTFAEVPRLMSADVTRSRESIRAIAGRDIARAFSGHGPPADDAGGKLRALAARLAG